MTRRVRTSLAKDIYENLDILVNPEQYVLIDLEMPQEWGVRETILQLVDWNCIFIMDGELVRVSDIYADYVAKEVFCLIFQGQYVPIPQLYYERFKDAQLHLKYFGFRVPVNQTWRKKLLWSDGKFTTKNLYALYKSSEGKLGTIRINLQTEKTLSSTKFNADVSSLFLKYMGACVGYYNESSEAIYWTNDKKHLKKVEKLLYNYIEKRVPGVRRLGKYSEINYSDVIYCPAHEILQKFSHEELNLDKSCTYRRLDFELAVIEAWWSKKYWVGWTKSNCQNVLSGKHYFCKYTERGYSMVLTRAWLV